MLYSTLAGRRDRNREGERWGEGEREKGGRGREGRERERRGGHGGGRGREINRDGETEKEVAGFGEYCVWYISCIYTI